MRPHALLVATTVALLACAKSEPTSTPTVAATDAASAQRAAQSIAESDFLRMLSVIADDSMRGRATPSPELEKTASYIASAFAQAGLTAGGDNGTFIQRFTLTSPSGASAPNVVGVLEGSDPALRSQYVIVNAHMDHIGVVGGGQNCAQSGADVICNGANDNGSGAIGIVQLARAFASLTTRPRRTMIFATFGGEERGLLGSAYFAAHPTRPIANAAAEINLDMIGRNARDSLFVLGKSYSSMNTTVSAVSSAHPDVGMKLVDDGWNGLYFTRSDHYSFVKLGVPVLFFFNGVTSELHTAADHVALMDTNTAVRSLQMIFYVALEVANADARPTWDAAARARWVPAGR